MEKSLWSKDHPASVPGWSIFKLHQPVPRLHEIAGYSSTGIKEELLARHLWRPSRPSTPFKAELSLTL